MTARVAPKDARNFCTFFAPRTTIERQTGAGAAFGNWIIGLGDKSLFLALVMTMLLSILLGTGIQTIPPYIITAALAAPALAKLGVALIVSGVQFVSMGLLGEIIARTYYESQNKPIYALREVISHRKDLSDSTEQTRPSGPTER